MKVGVERELVGSYENEDPTGGRRLHFALPNRPTKIEHVYPPLLFASFLSGNSDPAGHLTVPIHSLPNTGSSYSFSHGPGSAALRQLRLQDITLTVLVRLHNAPFDIPSVLRETVLTQLGRDLQDCGTT